MSRLVYSPRICPNCNTSYAPRRHDQTYCGSKCQIEASNRETLRARMLYRELYAWRQARGSGRMGKLLGDVSRKMDEFISEDRELGRPAPPMPQRILDEDYTLRMKERGYVKG